MAQFSNAADILVNNEVFMNGTKVGHIGAVSVKNDEASSTNKLFTALNTPALRLSVRQQQVQDIVLELQRFYALIANQRVQIREGFGTWNQVMAQMASQESDIRGTLQQADSLLTNLDTLVRGEGGNIQALLTNLPQALSSANAFLDQANLIGG